MTTSSIVEFRKHTRVAGIMSVKSILQTGQWMIESTSFASGLLLLSPSFLPIILSMSGRQFGFRLHSSNCVTDNIADDRSCIHLLRYKTIRCAKMVKFEVSSKQRLI
jgi:hypothetical protein